MQANRQITQITRHQALALSFVLLTIRSAIAKEAQLVQQIGKCSNEEYFNVNLLQCVRCEQTLEQTPERNYLSYIKPVQFNQAFDSALGHQNFSFNAHSAATSSVANQLQIQSNLQRSPDGLSCVCKKGAFRFKRSSLVNEMLCFPCPNRMVSSLNGNTCAFCRQIPRSYLLRPGEAEQPQFARGDEPNAERRPKSTKPSSDDCGQCGENEILVERLINSSELAALNRTALFANYNYSTQFNSTHLDQLLVQICVSCPSKISRSINNQCKACHFSFENCGCESESPRLVESNGVCIYANNPILKNPELYKINCTAEPNGLEADHEDGGSTEEPNKDNYISPYIVSNLPSSFSQCNYYHNITACQFLANACVLNHYRHRPSSGASWGTSANGLSSICDLYAVMYAESRSTPNYLPQFYLKTDSGESNKDFLFRIMQKSSPIEFGLNERLLFYAVAYSANGEFRQSRRLYLDELLICSSKDQSMDAIVRFAVNVEFKCRMQLSRLFESTPINADDQLFYELYLLLNQTTTAALRNQSAANQANQLIYPVYVLNRNLIKNDQLVNQIGYTLQYFNYLMDHSNYFSELINRWQLVKRFFVAEQLTSRKSVSTRSGRDGGQQAAGIDAGRRNLDNYGDRLRYVSKMRLMIRSNPEQPKQIYPPLLILEYSQVTKQQLERTPDRTVRIDLDVQFESNELGQHKKLTVLLAVFCSLSVLLALFRTWAWAKRSNHDNTLNLTILFKFFLFNCDYLANLFFVLVLLIAVHSFLIYKLQSVVYCFLPSKSLEHYFQLYIILAFSLKSVSILNEFYIRSDIDVFFIDWEKSRSGSRAASSEHGKAFVNNFSNNLGSKTAHEPINNNLNQETDNHLYKYLNQRALNGNAAGANQAANGNSDNQRLMQHPKSDDNEQFIKSSQLVDQFNQNAKYIDQYPDVSIWRTLFVANEYCELSAYRRVSTSYHLFILLIVLQCVGFENFAKADLELSVSSNVSQRHVTSSFSSRFVVGSLTFLVTVLFNYAFTKYYLESFSRDKISEFVDFCSVSNVSIFCLIYERFGYYVHGKSVTGCSEVNMPTMHQNLLTEEEDLCSKRGLLPNSDVQCFQMFLNDKLVMNYKKIRALLKQKTQNGLRVALHKKQSVQKIWYSYYLMNKLLSGFIDHMFVEMDYIVKERSPFEMLLDAELTDAQMLDKSIFFLDKFHSFENVLFVGVELDVILYELMFFALIDLLTFNYIAAISFTFILNQILEKAFVWMAKKNLIKKSLVDERFLL